MGVRAGCPGPAAAHLQHDRRSVLRCGRYVRLRSGRENFRGGREGAFAFAPKGLEHTYWNEGKTSSKMLITISPPGFEHYFEELAEGLEAAGDDEQAVMSVRKALSEKYDIEVDGPPRQATN